MNVLDTLDKELKDRELTRLQKLRYLYIRCCQLFYYDTRYAFRNCFDDEVEKEILNKKIDLCDVEDFNVICHSFANQVLFNVIKELTDLNPVYVGKGRTHSLILIDGLLGEQWRLDGTISDLSRTKMNLFPTGMSGNISNSATTSFKKIDSKLGFSFIDDQDYVNMSNGNSDEETFENIRELLDSNPLVNIGYSESNYFVNKCTSHRYSKNTFSDKDYNFHKLISIGQLYYDLCKKGDSYLISQIDKKKYNELVKSLKRSSDYM